MCVKLTIVTPQRAGTATRDMVASGVIPTRLLLSTILVASGYQATTISNPRLEERVYPVVNYVQGWNSTVYDILDGISVVEIANSVHKSLITSLSCSCRA